MADELKTLREIILAAIARPGIDLVLEGYAPLVMRIERDLSKSGYEIVQSPLGGIASRSISFCAIVLFSLFKVM